MSPPPRTARRIADIARYWAEHAPEARTLCSGAGRLTYGDRRRELIKRSGFNVFPIEVASVLNSHADALQSFLAAHLAAYKRPARSMRIDIMSGNANGKVRKHELEKLLSIATPTIAAAAI
jgi:acyl-CoA synthetase (AMP-forming)/AMP-acid ligase II